MIEQLTNIRNLRILSIGTTRSLWESNDYDGGTLARLSEYSKRVQVYKIIVHSLRKHKLNKSIVFGENGWAIPTNGFCVLESWIKMILYSIYLIKRYSLYLVQAQDPVFTGSVGYLVSRLYNIPLNVCVYGSNPFDTNWVNESKLNKITAPIGRFILQYAQGIQTDGTKTKENLIQNGIDKQKIFIKPMIPVELDNLFNAEPDSKLRYSLLDEEKFRYVAIFVGRLVPQKNLKLLLDIAEKSKKEDVGLRFICIGEGELQSELEKETRIRGLQNQIEWLGKLPHNEAMRLIVSSDVFLLTSNYEGFARVLMEAAACGIPIITTDVSGANDAVIHGQNGYIVPINDLKMFWFYLNELMNNPSKLNEMGERGREHISRIVNKYKNPGLQIDIWTSILSKDNNTFFTHNS